MMLLYSHDYWGSYYGMTPSLRLSVRPVGARKSRTEACKNFKFEVNIPFR